MNDKNTPTDNPIAEADKAHSLATEFNKPIIELIGKACPNKTHPDQFMQELQKAIFLPIGNMPHAAFIRANKLSLCFSQNTKRPVTHPLTFYALRLAKSLPSPDTTTARLLYRKAPDFLKFLAR